MKKENRETGTVGKIFGTEIKKSSMIYFFVGLVVVIIIAVAVF